MLNGVRCPVRRTQLRQAESSIPRRVDRYILALFPMSCRLGFLFAVSDTVAWKFGFRESTTRLLDFYSISPPACTHRLASVADELSIYHIPFLPSTRARRRRRRDSTTNYPGWLVSKSIEHGPDQCVYRCNISARTIRRHPEGAIQTTLAHDLKHNLDQ